MSLNLDTFESLNDENRTNGRGEETRRKTAEKTYKNKPHGNQ